MTLKALPIKEIALKELPNYFRFTGSPEAPFWNVFIELGETKPSGNGLNAYVQERACSGRICRVLKPETSVSSLLVIRDDGTVWEIDLRNFKEAWRLKVLKEVAKI